MTTIPALSSVNNILDTDLVLIEHSNGEGFKMTGADLKALMKAQAVDTVVANNMNSVTSNAVAQVVSNKSDRLLTSGAHTTFVQLANETYEYGKFHVVDYIASNISNYNNGDAFSMSLGGAQFTGTVYKLSDQYFALLVVGYTEAAITLCVVNQDNKSILKLG